MTNETIKLVIAEPQLFIDCMNSISKLVDEINIVAKPTHLEVVSMDPANVAMVIFKMMNTEFVEYDVKEEMKFGLKLSQLRQVLSRGGKDSILGLIVKDQLKVLFSGKAKKEFTIPLIEVEKKTNKIPDLKFNVEITLENNELKEAVADAGIVGEAAELKLDSDKFVVNATGDGGKVVSEAKTTSINKLNTSEAGAKYSIDYLDKMISTKLSKTVKVSLGKDYPVKLTYVNDKGSTSIDYILAPRVDSN